MGTKERLEILVGTQSKGKTQEIIKDLLKRISNLEYEVERLHSIIKEVREYIELYCNTDLVLFKELLEILEKESKEWDT